MSRKYAEGSDILFFYLEGSSSDYEGVDVQALPLELSDGYLDLLASGDDMVCTDGENEPTAAEETEERVRSLLPREYSKYSHNMQKL